MELVMQIHHLLEDSVYCQPDKNAVWFKDKWHSYKELNHSADVVARYIVNRGVKRGDRVAILLENSFDYIVSYFGILKAGAVVVGLNTETNTESLIYLLNDSDTKLIILQKKYNRFMVPALSHCPVVKDVLITDGETSTFSQFSAVYARTFSYIEDSFDKPVSIRSIDIDLAEIVYTSGSTGKPKGVMLTHHNLVTNMASICSYLNLTEEDRIMVILPFYYIYGKSLLLTHIMKCASIVIDNRFVYPNKVLETMKDTEVTGFAGVPSTFMILLSYL